jgi:hypothetical protein
MSDQPELKAGVRNGDTGREAPAPGPAVAPVLAGPIGPTPDAVDSPESLAKAARWSLLGDRRWRWELPL